MAVFFLRQEQEATIGKKGSYTVENKLVLLFLLLTMYIFPHNKDILPLSTCIQAACLE